MILQVSFLFACLVFVPSVLGYIPGMGGFSHATPILLHAVFAASSLSQ